MEHYLLNFHAGSFDFQVASYTLEENAMLEEFDRDSLTNYYLSDFREYLEETERDLKEGIAPSSRGNRYSSKMKKDVFSYIFEKDSNVEKNKCLCGAK